MAENDKTKLIFSRLKLLVNFSIKVNMASLPKVEACLFMLGGKTEK